MPARPWDSRIASALAQRLARTPVTPNQITTASMLLGFVGAGLIATGDPMKANIGAAVFMLSLLLDHSDGALARAKDMCTRFGHYYDHVAGGLTYVALFICVGIGMRDSWLGPWAIPLGFAAVAALVPIFGLRLIMEHRGGAEALDQPTFAGFEIEDLLYMIGPVTWLGWLDVVLPGAGVGTPIFALWVVWQFLTSTRAARTRETTDDHRFHPGRGDRIASWR